MSVDNTIRVVARSVIGLITVLHLAACGQHTDKQAETKSQDVAVVHSEKSDALLTAQITSSPLLDSPYGWGPGFAKARGSGPGVVVGPGGGNPNVFAQQFSVKPDEPFKLIARASSVNTPTAKGRFQVNWNDSDGKFISAAIWPFDVTPEEEVFERIVQAPAKAATGTLYVVGDGPDDVVRYTEMRVLGRPRAVVGETNAKLTESRPSLRSRVVSGNGSSSAYSGNEPNPIPRPSNLTPLDGSGKPLTVAESQYYFYHAAKAMQRRAQERGMDFIMYVMPDYNISRLMPAITQLRAEGIKVLAYAPQANWPSGVDSDWYWQKADSHWTEAAVRLTADEILHMWKTQNVANRPFSADMQRDYATGFPSDMPGPRADR